MAEDHLTVILEDGDIECAISFKYAEKALNFIRRFLNYHSKAAENTVTDSADVAKTTDKAPVQEFMWKMTFTDLVEMLDALIEMNAVEIPERCRKDFITAVFRLFGVKKVSLTSTKPVTSLLKRCSMNLRQLIRRTRS